MAYDESPTARALLTLELIQSAPGITAERIGQRLRVTERAARRYVAVLREAGLPVESVRGPYGGYRLGRGSRTPLMFSTAEALGLVMAVLDGHHDVSDGDSPVGAAIGKITRALPEPVARTVQAVRRAASAAPDRAAARPDAETTSALVQSCVDRRQLALEYRLRPDRTWPMVVDPWAVVVRHARWYLLCWSHTADARRVLRIDRVATATETGETFTPPEIDPVATVEENLAEGWEYGTEVIFEGPRELVSRCLAGGLGRWEETVPGRCRLIGSTSAPEWYAEQLAASPVPFKIIGGPELGGAAAELGRRLIAAAD